MCTINSIEEIDFNELWMKTKENSSHGKKYKDCSMIWADKAMAKWEDRQTNKWDNQVTQLELFK